MRYGITNGTKPSFSRHRHCSEITQKTVDMDGSTRDLSHYRFGRSFGHVILDFVVFPIQWKRPRLSCDDKMYCYSILPVVYPHSGERRDSVSKPYYTLFLSDPQLYAHAWFTYKIRCYNVIRKKYTNVYTLCKSLRGARRDMITRIICKTLKKINVYWRRVPQKKIRFMNINVRRFIYLAA